MINQKLLKELQEYVEEKLNIDHAVRTEERVHSDKIFQSDILDIEMEHFIEKKRKPPFNQVLFSYIDQKGASDPEIYKKAGLDRRHFSKIRTNPNYRVKKSSAIALALALELDLEETEDLLSSAGYSLSDSDTYDLVIQFCIEKKIYGIDEVNQALDHFGLKPLVGLN